MALKKLSISGPSIRAIQLVLQICFNMTNECDFPQNKSEINLLFSGKGVCIESTDPKRDVGNRNKDRFEAEYWNSKGSSS